MALTQVRRKKQTRSDRCTRRHSHDGLWGPRVSAMARRRLFVLLLAAPGDTAGGPETATITSGVLFNDTAGAPVHAHGAGVVPPGDHPSGRAGQYFIVGTSQKMPPSWLSDSVNLVLTSSTGALRPRHSTRLRSRRRGSRRPSRIEWSAPRSCTIRKPPNM